VVWTVLDEVVREHVFNYASASGCGFEGDDALGLGGGGGMQEDGAVEEDIQITVPC